MQTHSWHDVYDFWFPAALKNGDLEFHKGMVSWWMHGGATPQLSRFNNLVATAASGGLKDWEETPQGRLSLILVLDQFPRGLFAGTGQAYVNDRQALHLCEEGLKNGHYDQLQIRGKGSSLRCRCCTRKDPTTWNGYDD